MSEASYLWPGSRALKAFGFLMLKYTFSYILIVEVYWQSENRKFYDISGEK